MTEDTHRDDIAAYLLGALDDREAAELERHVEDCPICREELERLRPAIDVLPEAVPMVDPPPAVKAAVMSVVEREAGLARRPVRRRFWLFRPMYAAAVAAVLAIGILAGFLVSSSDEASVVTARVDRERVPSGSASLRVEDGRGELRVRGFPRTGRATTYQLWLNRDGRVTSAGLFAVGPSGEADAAVTPRLTDRDQVLVTREPRGGSPEPTEQPLLNVEV
jgi:anti-sigma-K factor RskA